MEQVALAAIGKLRTENPVAAFSKALPPPMLPCFHTNPMESPSDLLSAGYVLSKEPTTQDQPGIGSLIPPEAMPGDE